MTFKAKSKILCFITILLNLVVGILSLRFGLHQEFVTLFGFGMDCIGQALLSGLFFLKLFSPSPDKALRFEKWWTMILGILFIQLSIVICFVSFLKLSKNEGPVSTLNGLLISVAVIAIYGVIWKFKDGLLKSESSQVVFLDANSNLSTIKLGITLLVTSSAKFYIPSLWWVDNFFALFLAFQIGKEGLTQVLASRRGDLNSNVQS